MDGLQRRPAAAAAASARGEGQPPGGQRVIHCDVEPTPRAWPGMQMLALAAILVLVGIQFLPATHVRHPADPSRTWVPVDRSGHPQDLSHEVASVDVFSSISCLDLRTLAVLTNSTLSSSSDPHHVSFNFVIPEGGNDQVPYYKIKAVLPDSNITVTSQKRIKDKLNLATPEGNFFALFPDQLSPIAIARALSRKRYVYISADSIIKGKIEDLVRIDLGSYAVGASEDCSKHLGDYISMDVLNAVQRSAPRGLLHHTETFDKDACLLDFDVLLVEPRNIKRNLIDSIAFWAKAVKLANPRDSVMLAMTLAFYHDYLKLPTNWKRANANTDILYYDGPKNVCEDGRQHQEKGSGEIWQQYLGPKSDSLLST